MMSYPGRLINDGPIQFDNRATPENEANYLEDTVIQESTPSRKVVWEWSTRGVVSPDESNVLWHST